MTTSDIILEEHEDEAFGDADIVEWYETRPVTVPSAIAAGAILAAFTLGAVTAAGILTLLHRLDD